MKAEAPNREEGTPTIGALNSAEAGPGSVQRVVRPDQVVKTSDGQKYVAAKEHPLPEGAEIVAYRPHGDGDFSYCCGLDYCRCMQ